MEGGFVLHLSTVDLDSRQACFPANRVLNPASGNGLGLFMRDRYPESAFDPEKEL